MVKRKNKLKKEELSLKKFGGGVGLDNFRPSDQGGLTENMTCE